MKTWAAPADQAKGPFLNPKEQALPDAAGLVGRVCAARLIPICLRRFGAPARDADNTAAAYDNIGYSDRGLRSLA